MEKRQELYAGKAKSVYTTNSADQLILLFRDDISAFDGKKKQQLDQKGIVNNKFNAFIMEKLAAADIPTHFDSLLSPYESLVKRMDMMPIECVIRNIAAGSVCRRLGIEEGIDLHPPIFELFLKNDALGDPMINEYHIETLHWAKKENIEVAKKLTFKINDILKPLFLKAGILLVDFKLEFGVYEGQVLLGDELTPDSCRLWDAETRTKFDKDRFRKDLGNVVEAYQEVGHRLGIVFD